MAARTRWFPPRLFPARFDALEAGACRLCNRAARMPGVRSGFAGVSRLGDGPAWYLLMLALAMLQGPAGRLAALQMAVSGLAGVTVYKLLKSRLVRERPFVAHAGIHCGTAPLDRYSFPSGHTLHAVLFATLAVAWFPGLAVVLVPFAVLVAASRVILGLHYPSDVLAGAAIGWLLARLALAVYPPA